MDRQVRRRLTQDVQHYPCLGKNGYSERTFGVPVARKCYIEGKITTVRLPGGKEVLSMQKLYFDGNIAVTADDDIQIGSKRYQVMSYAFFPGIKPSDSGLTVVYL